MTRIPFAICLALCIVTSAAILAGCGKRNPVLLENPDNFAPTGVTAIPDTVKVTLQWTRNTEAEGQSGFQGYYVYCTSRTDGLTRIPSDSLQYFQVPNCPFTNTNTVVVTHDARTGQLLKVGTKYYFYVRTMINNVLSLAADRAISSPRPEGDGYLFGFVISDTLAPANGIRSGFGWTTGATSVTDTTYKMPLFVWRDTLIDSTQVPPVITVNPADHDSVIRGFNAEDTTVTLKVLDWKVDTNHALGTLTRFVHKRGWAIRDPLALIDLVGEIAGSQVQLTSPNINLTIPLTSAWGAEGRETLISELPGGWSASSPTTIDPLARQVTLSVGQTGQTYQLYTFTYKYAKIRIDSVQTVGATIKVNFHYAFQLVTNVKSF